MDTELNIISPRTGTAFILKKGESLQIIDIEGQQVADLMCYNQHDTNEYLSSGRTIDYNETVFLTKNHKFYSNRSTVMFEITADCVGRHDFLLTPCSKDTFRIIYGDKDPHHGCHGNLYKSLKPFGITEDNIPITFNVFMNVDIDSKSGQIKVLPPLSKAQEFITIKASMDLVVGLTACSAGQSNNFKYKPIGYRLEK
jgi:uncharacterized protein YcgI (DUF1989 family)